MSGLSNKVISVLGKSSVFDRLSSKSRMQVEGMKTALLKGVEHIADEELDSAEAHNAIKELKKLLKKDGA